MSRLQATFKRLQREGRKALIPYATAGYPYADITPALMHVLVEAGADVNLADGKGVTPLQHARAGGYDEIEKTLVAAGAR